MSRLTVLEYLRSADGVWNLPSDHVERLRAEFPDVRFLTPRRPDEIERDLPAADVVLGWAVTRENFNAAERLRWIQITAAGVGNLLFPAMVESDVVITNGRGLHGLAMAEHTIGVMLSFARKLHLSRDAQRERRWTQEVLWNGEPPFRQLQGATLGIVGLGSVGRPIAERARALGMRVIAVRKHPASDPAPADEQWGTERFLELVRSVEWLVLAAPLTAETRRLIGDRELALMRPDAILVNLGRGSLVDEAALVRALEHGRIAGAALDVFEREPLAAESPLWSMPNVIVTPHSSGLGPGYWERAIELFAGNLSRYLRGEPLRNLVDKRAGY